MKTIHLSKNKWGCFEFIKYALHGSGTYYYGSCKCTPETYFRICVWFLKMEVKIKWMLYNLIAFLYIRPKAAHYAEVLTNSTKNAGQPLSSSVGWLEAVHHCSLKMKEGNPFCRVNRQVHLSEPNESCYKKSKVWKVQPKTPRSRTARSQMVLCL